MELEDRNDAVTWNMVQLDFGIFTDLFIIQFFLFCLKSSERPRITKTWQNSSCASANWDIVLGINWCRSSNVKTKKKTTPPQPNTQHNSSAQAVKQILCMCACVWAVKMLPPVSFRGRRPEWDERWPLTPHRHWLAGPQTSSLHPSGSRLSRCESSTLLFQAETLDGCMDGWVDRFKIFCRYHASATK